MFELTYMTVYVRVCVCMCMCAYLCPYVYVCVACVRECLNMCACVYLRVYISIYNNKTKYCIVIFVYTVHISLDLCVIFYFVMVRTMQPDVWWRTNSFLTAHKILQCCHVSKRNNLRIKIFRDHVPIIPCQFIWRQVARTPF